MAATASCPPDETLIEFIDGRLEAEALAQLEQHLDRCAACTELLATCARAALDAPTATSTRLPAGTRVGRYLVIDLVGAGGMGVVYAAYDPQLDRKVALKLIRVDSIDAQTHQARLAREALALARVSHPNTTAIFDAGQFGDRVFLAMELVDGSDLAAWLHAAPRSTAQIMTVFLAAGQGLAAAHAAGLVHRDFKPSNVLVGRDERVKVSDFGLARLLDRELPGAQASPSSSAGEASSLTATGAVVGTAGYLAPEQLTDRSVDARADQFAFCAALYEALFGARPFAGDTLEALSSTYRSGVAATLPSDGRLPPWTRAALARGLALEAANRFPSMRELLDGLTRDPRARYKRMLIFGTAAALLTTVAWLAHREFPTSAARCEEAGREVQQLWNPAAAGRLRAAFVATAAPYAGSVASDVDRLLTRRTAELAAMQVEACAATRVRATQSELVLDLRTTCLAHARREISATVEVLAHPDAALVARAPEVVGRLSPVERCADVETLRAPELPPPWMAKEIEAVRAELAAPRAALQAGRSATAAPALELLSTRARGLAFRPLEAEIALLLAELHDARGDHARAATAASEAVYAAMAGRDERALFEACRALAGQALTRDGPAAGDPWLRCSRAVAERLHAQPALGAELTYLEAQFADRGGDARRAFELHRQALAETEAARGNEDPAVMRMMFGLGVQALEIGRSDEALALAERALALGERTLGPEHVDVARARLLLGYARAAMHDAKGALAALGSARPVLEREYGTEHEEVASMHEAMANAFDEQHRVDESRSHYLQAVAIRRKRLGAKDVSVAASLYNLANMLNHYQRYDEALRYLDEAQPIYVAANSAKHVTVGVCLLERGRALHERGQAKEALAALANAKSILESQTDDAETLGDLDRLLALELWTAHRSEPARAAMRAAGLAYARGGATDAALQKQAQAAEAWLAAHPGS